MTDWLMRSVALVVITFVAVWMVLEVVSLAIGATEFGWSQVVRARVRVAAELLMWGTIATMIAHRAWVLFFGLICWLGLLETMDEHDDDLYIHR